MRTKLSIRFLVIAILFITNPLSGYTQTDECAGITTPLTSSTTACSFSGNGTHTFVGATPSIVPAGGCAVAGTHRDIWFSFVAVSSTHSVTLGNIGGSITSPQLQLYGGSCAALVSIQCSALPLANPSLTQTGLTVGSTYYIRVSHMGGALSGGGPSNRLDICLTHPQPPPANDECSGAISLTANVSCSNTTGTLISATASASIPTGCAGIGTHYDVWYSFTAAQTYELISISGRGTNFTNPEIQLFSGTCGSLTSIACGTTSMYGTSLIVGSTYYVRVSNVGAAISSNGGFSICVYHPAASGIEYGRSYINVTRGATGGTVSPGDTLEMRATFVITGTGSAADSLAFYDTLYNTKGLRLVPGSIALRTNEGKVYRQDSPVKTPFSDAFDTDPGWRYQNGLDTIVRINFGTGASNFARGALTEASRPRAGGGCIIMATYRVVVYAGYNSLINFKTGSLSYRDVSTGIYIAANFAPNNLIVYQSPGLCPNAVSPTNAIGIESNGTFGAPSGSAPWAQNRSASPQTTYTYTTISTTSQPGDSYYSIVNNTARTPTTVTTYAKPEAPTTYRVYGLFDISGDHTGASNTALGNSPCNLNQPISATNPCGYMLVINSSYKPDTAFTYAVTNLCPNTYYEMAAWFKNICSKCGVDSMGTQSINAGYVPSATGDSSGVRPNVAFDVDGIDYYTTGDIRHSGTPGTASDAGNLWVKRGFTYLTGPAQTSLTLTLRNNAPGGGGNDWMLDDIAVATCTPNLAFTPSTTPPSCSGNPLTIGGTVTSYFNNYTNYKWQKSTDGGVNWINGPNDANTTGVGSPTLNGSGQYVYTVSYQTQTLNLSDNGIKFRLVTATTNSNLASSSCALSGGIDEIVIPNIGTCPILGINFISFNGKIENGTSVLNWTTNTENNIVSYLVEKSVNGNPFSPVATVPGHNISNNSINSYSWSEPYIQGQKLLYRVKLITAREGKTSKIILLNDNQKQTEIISVVNPFTSNLVIDIQSFQAGNVKIEVIDNNGNITGHQSFTVGAGSNKLQMNKAANLPAGLYTLRIRTQEGITIKKVLKL